MFLGRYLRIEVPQESYHKSEIDLSTPTAQRTAPTITYTLAGLFQFTEVQSLRPSAFVSRRPAIFTAFAPVVSIAADDQEQEAGIPDQFDAETNPMGVSGRHHCLKCSSGQVLICEPTINQGKAGLKQVCNLSVQHGQCCC
jgi:hypothetical protein